MFVALFVALFLLIPRVFAQAALPSWPLAVKAPFFNAWYKGGSSSVPLPLSSPINWSFYDKGWYCVAIVDGVAFRLMGASENTSVEPAQQLAIELTPTRTIFALQAGPMLVNLTFFTPVTPSDFVRQSIPFSYLYATTVSSDSSSHSIKIYSDILPDWLTSGANLTIVSDAIVENGMVLLSSQLQTPQAFTVVNDTTYDGILCYSIMANNSNVTYQVGSDVRNIALNSTSLANTIEAPTLSSSTTEMGIYVDLGEVAREPLTTVWAIGFYRDPVVQYLALSGELQERSSYFLANFSSLQDVASFFLNDFDNATHAADIFDAKITGDATNISPTYKDLVLPIVRQVMSTVDITISKNSDGSWNTTDVFAFVYDLGLAGFNGPNPVDILYAAFPAFLYLNPSLAGNILRPIFDLQDTDLYEQQYPAVNLGLGYPNVSVHNKPHAFGIETSADMIIMTLAHFQSSEDLSIISQHYGVLKRWGDYLVDNAMNPGNQTTSPADFITLRNQTNLSLKGILGIAAMAKISHLLDHAEDSLIYQENATLFIQQWQSLSTSEGGDRLLSAFAQQDSGGVIYNLYADKLLELDLVPEKVHETQTAFYKTQFSSNSNPYGIPLEVSNPTVSRADWIMFAAAAATDSSVRDDMLTTIRQYISSGVNDSPLGPVYDPVDGGLNSSYRAASSPAMGSMFAILALSSPIDDEPGPDISGTPSATTKRKINISIIIGTVVSVVFGLVLLIILIMIVRYRVRISGRQAHAFGSVAEPGPDARNEQFRSFPNGTIEPHPNVALEKLPEGPVLRKSRDGIPFTSSLANTPGTTPLLSSIPSVFPASRGSSFISTNLQSVGQLAAAEGRASDVLVITREGEGTVGMSEALPRYEELEGARVGGSIRRA